MLKKNYFLKINNITLGSVIVLILVGSIVRTLGAGMGCPDWPKCFGEYIPPTSSDQLPDNYLDIFLSQRLQKNERLAKAFSSMGFEGLADKITNDPTVLKEQEFNTTKAWVEYINRLVGVLIGLFVFLNMICSLTYWKENRSIAIAAIAIFVLTGFQGWVGSLVVSTNLLHGFITFHMLLALLILALLIWINFKVRINQTIADGKVFVISIVALSLLIVQIILGTEVRGVIDDLIANETIRKEWINFLDVNSFYIHRSFSWLLLISTGVLYYFMKRHGNQELSTLIHTVCGLVLAGMLLGIGMVWFDFQAWMQPLHLIVATGLFSLLFYLTLRFKLRDES